MLRDLPELAFPIAIDVYLAPIDQAADALATEGRVHEVRGPCRRVRLRVSDPTQAVLRRRVELVKRHMSSGPGPGGPPAPGPAPGIAPGGPPAPGPGPGACCGCCCCCFASCACCASRSGWICAACVSL